MSDTVKTITISNEAYMEIKRLNEANAALVERWAKMKGILIIDIARNKKCGYEQEAEVLQDLLNDMKEMEKE